jgi:hypothetical protein
MLALLAEGAKYDGGTPYQAAVHLLLFTELPGTISFARHVTVDDRYSFTCQTSMRVALVPSFPALLRDKKLRVGQTDHAMLTIASSLAEGTKISLDDTLSSSLGSAHVGRIAEAVFIRCSAGSLLTVGGTAKLDDLNALRRKLSGGEP